MARYKKAFDYLPQIKEELLNSKFKEHWEKVFAWFKFYEPKNSGEEYLQDSIFTDKYVQSIAHYKSMIKLINYIYRGFNDDTFEYEYNSSRIDKVQKWFSLMRLKDGSFDKAFILEAPQVYIMVQIYGLSKKEKFLKPEEVGKTPVFAVDKTYLTATRKNGKSELFAGLGTFVQQNPFGNDYSPQVYAAGPLEDSSKIIWDKAKKLVKTNPFIEDLYEKINERSFRTYGGGIFAKLPFKKEKIEGQNPSLGILTEFHLHKSTLVVDSFESSSNLSRINQNLLFDTTKGDGINGLAHTREREYKEIIDEQLQNPLKNIGINIAGLFWEVDDMDDPKEIDNPWESNPLRKSTFMLGVIISLDKLQQEWTIAKRDPIKRREFLIKKFGKWIGLKDSLFEFDDLVQCNERFENEYKLEELARNNSECIMTIDLANSGDTNAVTLTFKDNIDGEDVPLMHSKIFVPKNTIEERAVKENKPYHKWIENGFVELCGDRVVDHDYISDYVKELTRKYNVKKIYYDAWHFHTVKSYLIGKGVSEYMFEEIKNQAKELSAPIEDIIKKVYNKNIYFWNNPVTTDQFLNFVPTHNRNGQVYMTKSQQENRIDIFATAVMAISKLDTIKPVGKKRGIGLVIW